MGYVFCMLLVMKLSHKEKLHLLRKNMALLCSPRSHSPFLPPLYCGDTVQGFKPGSMLGKSCTCCLKERREYATCSILLSFPFMTYLFSCGLDHLKTQGFGSIHGHQWKECCRDGTALHNNAALNETIYFEVFKGLIMQLLEAPL